jgi:DNA-binding NarL/FixJ family response regulator
MSDLEPVPDVIAELLVVGTSPLAARLVAETLEPVGLRRATCVSRESEALAALMAFKFDAAIIDLELPDGDGLNVVWGLQALPSPCSAVIVGEDVDAAAIREALMVGVIACLRTPLRPDLLRTAALHAVESTRLWRRCIEAAPDARADARRTTSRIPPTIGARDMREAGLTAREQEVLALLLDGMSNGRMAGHLGVTTRTVKYHVTNVLRKLGAQSRISLLASWRRTLSGGPA